MSALQLEEPLTFLDYVLTGLPYVLVFSHESLMRRDSVYKWNNVFALLVDMSILEFQLNMNEVE